MRLLRPPKDPLEIIDYTMASLTDAYKNLMNVRSIPINPNTKKDNITATIYADNDMGHFVLYTQKESY